MVLLLSDLIDPVCIELDLASRRKRDLINEMAEVLARGGLIRDTRALGREILKREKISTTGIGSGIAIPHCLTDQVTETRVAFGRRLEGAKFDAVDNQPVKLVFLLVGPEGDHAGHLQVLSRIARYLHDDAFCRRLLEAATPEEVITAFRAKEGV